jgi:hypothetical protein
MIIFEQYKHCSIKNALDLLIILKPIIIEQEMKNKYSFQQKLLAGIMHESCRQSPPAGILQKSS